MLLDVLNDAIVVLVDALLQFVLFGQVDAEGAEDSPDAQAAVTAMLEASYCISLLFDLDARKAPRFPGRFLPVVVLQPPNGSM